MFLNEANDFDLLYFFHLKYSVLKEPNTQNAMSIHLLKNQFSLNCLSRGYQKLKDHESLAFYPLRFRFWWIVFYF